MTLIKNADAASSPFLLTTLMDLLVEEKKGVPQQLLLDDPHSSLKWLPPSKPKEEHSPVHSVKNIQSALSWIFRNANQPSISILFCTDSKSLCEALISSKPRTSSIHNSINSLTLFRFPSLFNGSQWIQQSSQRRLHNCHRHNRSCFFFWLYLGYEWNNSQRSTNTQTRCTNLPTSKYFSWCKINQQQKRWCSACLSAMRRPPFSQTISSWTRPI